MSVTLKGILTMLQTILTIARAASAIMAALGELSRTLGSNTELSRKVDEAKVAVKAVADHTE